MAFEGSRRTIVKREAVRVDMRCVMCVEFRHLLGNGFPAIWHAIILTMILFVLLFPTSLSRRPLSTPNVRILNPFFMECLERQSVVSEGEAGPKA